jgi:hypothetical protein
VKWCIWLRFPLLWSVILQSSCRSVNMCVCVCVCMHACMNVCIYVCWEGVENHRVQVSQCNILQNSSARFKLYEMLQHLSDFSYVQFLLKELSLLHMQITQGLIGYLHYRISNCSSGMTLLYCVNNTTLVTTECSAHNIFLRSLQLGVLKLFTC